MSVDISMEIYLFSILVLYLHDLRPQKSEGLKGVYGLKSLYLTKDEKPFFTQLYANSNHVIVCGHENSRINNDHCASCFGKYSHDRNEEWMQCPAFMPAVV